MATLFDSLTQRSVTLPNRIVVSPMCQYSSVEGMPNEWHEVHLGSRAVGGASLVFTEASAVLPEGRISPADAGIWNDAQAEAWASIARFVVRAGAMPGMQLAHAGRKASTDVPWRGRGSVDPADGGWQPVAPSPIPYDPAGPSPRPLDDTAIHDVVAAFRDAAVRAGEAGFRVVELHAAHGYLLHEFLSPLANERTDAYGGGFDGRTRLLLEVADAVRSVWPEELPLWVRISATDWADGGWDLEQSVELARLLSARGVDLIDVSSGGLVPYQRVEAGPGYQVPFAERIRREAGIATGAVGLITEPAQAEEIVASGRADVVLLARELLRDPYFPRRAARALGAELAPPDQYRRAW
ncbi:MAG: NADH:flavin oxidoreductase/NADH oxidase [Thermoleophilia bacterium]|nr:NADH:flavin oxidoreductase/NADH oxidase [Thermoleophilia bacterium]MDH4345383.1 NADH:flavin oxidoreductase/NADH oxidase [Thermoleophilia bacterium]